MNASEITVQLRIERPDFKLDVDLQLPGHGISALFGHSGSGKTTCLRGIAGLEPAARGRVALGKQIWLDSSRRVRLPPHRRPIGYVFQEASLFPHLSVEQNLAFGQKRTAAARTSAELHREVQETAALLGIDHLLARAPASLSGGERQRAAIARALLTHPQLLLLDEPLAALDLRRKQEILPYLERLHDELSIPMIYVSHSPDEVARLADYLVLLEGGEVIAQGPLQETLARTDLPPIFADDAGVVLNGLIAEHEADGLTRVELGHATHFYVSCPDQPVGKRVRCRIHARDVSISLAAHADNSILNIFPAGIDSIVATEVPGHVIVKLILADGTALISRITERSRAALALQPGQQVQAQVKAVALLT
jgi:molybdate transport system ATP-binding protein